MKRALCIILAAVFALLLLPARAADEAETGASGKRDILVYANILDESKDGSGSQSGSDPENPPSDPPSGSDPSKDEDPLYSVELTWGNMTFDYDRNSADHWSVPKGTDENGLAVNEIRLENLSGAPILYRTSFTPADAQYSLTGTLTAETSGGEPKSCQYDDAYLPSPDEGENRVKKRHIDYVFLKISGTLPSDLSPGVVQVGKVTVEIKPYAGT